MDSRPTLYLSNFASYRTPGMHGPGRKLTIMARPRAWEVGEGTAHALMPQGFEVAAMQRAVALRNAVVPEAIDAVRAYRAMIEGRWAIEAKALRPRFLFYVSPVGMGGGLMQPVHDGDTLCCACSVAEARAGRCHRAWAAPFLARAGWRIVLDGVEVSDG